MLTAQAKFYRHVDNWLHWRSGGCLLLHHLPLLSVLIQGGCLGFQTLITDSPVMFMLSAGGTQQILNQQILNGSGRHRGSANTWPDGNENTFCTTISSCTQVRAGGPVALGEILVESIYLSVFYRSFFCSSCCQAAGSFFQPSEGDEGLVFTLHILESASGARQEASCRLCLRT